ncbi:MAG: AarF/ABC1/UbiB kinase family protein [Halobacteriales archaeon]|nr:AarF/ABC1/UbiB kinase family protein [Halobacteriales archaeon]
MVWAYWRLFKAFFRFLPFALAYASDHKRWLVFGRSRDVTPEKQRERARKLKETLIGLGPTYIKLGQVLSTRPDILPRPYIDELVELQDDVPPAPYEAVERVVVDELGNPDDVFDTFERDALSGASLGQVHVAYYRGEKVAVKVRRPGVESLVRADLRVLNICLPVVRRVARVMGEEAHADSLEGLADDFERRIRQEMNYRRERSMLEEIRRNFEGDDRVRIPRSYPEVSTERVLTLEYVEGIKINDVRRLEKFGHDTGEIAKNLEKAYLKMTLVDGVFHGDPHPGNLAVNADGQIVIYDFGMSGRLSPSLQDTLVDFYLSASNEDAEGVVDAMIGMGTLDRDVDRDLIVEVVEVAIEDYSGEDVDDIRIQQLMDEIEETIYEYPLRIPSYIALGLRVSTIVEGVCLELDPEFDFLGVAREFFIEEGYVQEAARGQVIEAWEEVREAFASALRTPAKFEKGLDKLGRDEVEVVVDVEDSREHIEKLGKRLSYALVASAAIVGAAVLTLSDTGLAPYLFGFGVVVLYLLRRSFKKRDKIRGPRYYATRHEKERDWEDDETDSDGYGNERR